MNVAGIVIRQDPVTKLYHTGDLRTASRLDRGKRVGSYFNNHSAKSLIAELCSLQCVMETQVKHPIPGHNGGTWVSEEVLIDMAGWFSPELKSLVQIELGYDLPRAVVSDEYRRDPDDERSKMINTLYRHFPGEFDSALVYARIDSQIEAACGVGVYLNRWEKATDEQTQMRLDIYRCAAADFESDGCRSIAGCLSRIIKTRYPDDIAPTF